jgi:hypothetical protein
MLSRSHKVNTAREANCQLDQYSRQSELSVSALPPTRLPACPRSVEQVSTRAHLLSSTHAALTVGRLEQRLSLIRYDIKFDRWTRIHHHPHSVACATPNKKFPFSLLGGTQPTYSCKMPGPRCVSRYPLQCLIRLGFLPASQ